MPIEDAVIGLEPDAPPIRNVLWFGRVEFDIGRVDLCGGGATQVAVASGNATNQSPIRGLPRECQQRGDP
jgi:hypothetical protein